MKFISLNSENWQKLVNERFNGILYLTDYHTLKKSAKENLNRMIEEKKVILVSLEAEDDFPYSKLIFTKMTNLCLQIA